MSALTLRDVAKHCGVSTATVSAVVNVAEWVSAETRDRVQRAVDELGYRPNQFARGLKTRRGYAVGVIVSDLTNPFFTEVVRSLGNALREDGRPFFVTDSDHRCDIGEVNLRTLVDGHVIGLVLVGDSVPEDVLRRYARRKGRVPIVAIERDYDIEGVSCLLADSERGAYEATRHLLGQGYRHLAMIGGPLQGAGSATFGRAQREHGFRRALEDDGLVPDPAMIVEGNFRYAGGQEAMRRLLAGGKPLDAVFAANDMMALGAMSVIRDAGLRVPEDIAVVGFDDIPAASLPAPGLTTMAMPKSVLGSSAALVLGKQLAAATRPMAVRRLFDPELVVRQSSVRHSAIRRVAGRS